MVETEDFFLGIKPGHLQVSIELLQGIVDPGTHECFNAFSLDLNLVDIGEFILVGASFIGGKL
jgi:hypothetical protein